MTTDEMIHRLMNLAITLTIENRDMAALACATCAGKLMVGEHAAAEAEQLLAVLP